VPRAFAALKRAAAPGFWWVITQPFRPFSTGVMFGLFLVWASIGLVYTLYDIYANKDPCKRRRSEGNDGRAQKYFKGAVPDPL